jgi:hypothetical protein
MSETLNAGAALLYASAEHHLRGKRGSRHQNPPTPRRALPLGERIDQAGGPIAQCQQRPYWQGSLPYRR